MGHEGRESRALPLTSVLDFFFYIRLTVHLGISIANKNQRDAAS
jgi:hypothetical protein